MTNDSKEKKSAVKNPGNSKNSKPKAGVDENGTFRAWDKAKTKDVKVEKSGSQPEKFVPGTTLEQTAKNLEEAKAKDPSLGRRKKAVEYTDDQVQHLDALEHIRLRSGMYIGRLGDGSNQNDGIYILLKEIIDNSVDEFIMGFGGRIDVTISLADKRVTVRDYGRGIPLGKVVDCVSQINTGAKYNDEVFQFSVGMNGVGTKAVNALSSYFRVVSVRDGECTDAVFERGKLKSQKTGKLKVKQQNGTYFEFIPDESIFGKYSFNMEFVEKRMWNYAYLNTGLTIRLNGRDFVSETGFPLPDWKLQGRASAVRVHPHERLRRELLLVRERTVHERRRHALERVQGRLPQGHQRFLPFQLQV